MIQGPKFSRRKTSLVAIIHSIVKSFGANCKGLGHDAAAHVVEVLIVFFGAFRNNEIAGVLLCHVQIKIIVIYRCCSSASVGRSSLPPIDQALRV